MRHLRQPSVAGIFYPADTTTLKMTISKYLSQAKVESKNRTKFLIVPHAGYSYSGKTAAEAYVEARDRECAHIMLIGPSHRHYFKGMAESEESRWRTPLGEISVKPLNIEQIKRSSQFHRDEHCLEVQVPFIHFLFPDAEISPLLLSGPISQAEKMADVLVKLDDTDTLWIISSDFNHTGPNFQHYPSDFGFDSGETMDKRAIAYITAGDIQGFSRFLGKTNATICGALPILVAMHLVKHLKLPNFIFKKYDCSGRQTGDDNSVGYAALYTYEKAGRISH